MYTRRSADSLKLISIVSVFIAFFSGCVHGNKVDTPVWLLMETRYTIIHYQSIAELKKFDHKISYPNGKWGVLNRLTGSGSENLHARIEKKVDLIYEKAQNILGMHKPMDKVHIQICRNKKQLNEHCISIYDRPCRFRAWYAYQVNTVFVNHKDLDEGILSHELAHSIIDQYLLVRPPKATAEILASYVDLHLFDDP
jgi:hypothetical protein